MNVHASGATTSNVASLLADATVLHRQRRLIEAESGYKAILKREPSHFEALHYLGIALTERKELATAISYLKQAAKVRAESHDVYVSLSRAYKEHGQLREAKRAMEKVLALKPEFAEAHNESGILSIALEEPERALECYRRALAIRPQYMEALYNSGNALVKLYRYEEALTHYDRALALQPNSVDVLHNKGNVLRTLQRYEPALRCYELATQAKPQHLAAQLGCAKMLELLRYADAALERYLFATKLSPSSAEAWYGAGAIYQRLARHAEALECYRRTLQLKPDFPGAASMLAFIKMCCCVWDDREAQLKRLTRSVDDNGSLTLPWLLCTSSDSLANQLRCARRWADTYFPPAATPLWSGERYTHAKIRIAYLSADFHFHATSLLLAGVFERHDRDRFEIYAISFGPNFIDAMRTRLEKTFDRFIDVSSRTDLEAARLIRELEIDIAVDLKGYTTDSRSGILAHRPAPVQVNYLGFPGTLGANYIDYIVADRIVIPPEDTAHYSERVVYLPESYQANDNRRQSAGAPISKQEAGLPERGFVFCCFNNNFKMTPEVFRIWMRLLLAVDGSVLWLLEDSPTAATNLRAEAVKAGVSPDRLVFAPRVSPETHLARHSLADLFLDTLPCNAHTTASDALWAGLPIVTCLGKSFAGRVCASLLHAVRLPELVTDSLEAYERLALELATDPRRLSEVKRRLIANRDVTPLFDTEQYTKDLEQVYTSMLSTPERLVTDP